jgi:hypothetical protein
LLAGTARFESLLLSVVAVAAVAGWWLLARRGRAREVPRSALLLALGVLALPIQWAHDWLLTGDPLFSLSVPVRGTPVGELLGPAERAIWIVQRYLDSGGLLFLGVLGAIALILGRRWGLLAGIAVLGPGIAAFLVFLEARHIYVSSRYAGPIDLVVLFCAGIGFAVVVAPGVRALLDGISRPRWVPSERGGLVITGLLAGALFASPFAPLSNDVVGTARSNLTLHSNAIRAEAVIASALGNLGAAGSGTDAGPVVLVPALLRPQVAVDLQLPVSAVGGLGAAALDPATVGLPAERIVYHDRRGDPPDPVLAVLESAVPTTVGSWQVIPIASDARLGWWVVRVTSGGG